VSPRQARPLSELSAAYRRRIERGIAAGASRGQARGHPSKVKGEKSLTELRARHPGGRPPRKRARPWRDVGGFGVSETASARRVRDLLEAAYAIRPGLPVAILAVFLNSYGKPRAAWLDDPWREPVRQLLAAARAGDDLGGGQHGVTPVGRVQLTVPIRRGKVMAGIPASDWLALIEVHGGDVWAAIHSVWLLLVQSP
jgi:hypothetical protein